MVWRKIFFTAILTISVILHLTSGKPDIIFVITENDMLIITLQFRLHENIITIVSNKL
jgi:hypothetical protein